MKDTEKNDNVSLCNKLVLAGTTEVTLQVER